jgi:hypothetical protein
MEEVLWINSARKVKYCSQSRAELKTKPLGSAVPPHAYGLPKNPVKFEARSSNRRDSEIFCNDLTV